MTRVIITHNPVIAFAVDEALENVEELESLTNGRLVAIKPNDTWASEHDRSAVTQPDTLRAVIGIVKRCAPRDIVVTGGSGAGDTAAIMKMAGLMDVIEEEGVAFFDHNKPPFVEVSLDYGTDPETAGQQRSVIVNPRVLEYETIIALNQLKVHETATVTLAMKNIAMSFPAADYYGHPRSRQYHRHHFFEDMHSFIAAMAKRFPIHLAVTVGHPAMVGAGPIGGHVVETGLVIAGTDAVAADAVGARLLGFDVQKKRVDRVNAGDSFITDVSSEQLSRAVAGHALEATTDQSRIKEVDVICICVPTPLTKSKQPDLSYVIKESEEIARYLRPAQLVILESTTSPGTTREKVLPILESSGLKAGSDFYLAFSPERVDPGSKKWNIQNTPKIVGGIDPASTRLAQMVYEQVTSRVVPVSCPEVAEMTKIFENVFRSVNIALVNELAQLCQRMGISAWEVIDAASSKPFGYMPFFPGPGVGGHCIPFNPYYLLTKAMEHDFHPRFIELATEINEQMPYYVCSRIMKALNQKGKSLNRARLLLLGIAYKPDVEDARESPLLKLMQLLGNEGARVSYHDPFISQTAVAGETLKSTDISPETLASFDCVIIGTHHSCYSLAGIIEHSRLVFDTRGVTRAFTGDNIVRLGE